MDGNINFAAMFLLFEKVSKTKTWPSTWNTLHDESCCCYAGYLKKERLCIFSYSLNKRFWWLVSRDNISCLAWASILANWALVFSIWRIVSLIFFRLGLFLWINLWCWSSNFLSFALYGFDAFSALYRIWSIVTFWW